MAFDKFLIAPFKSGLQTNLKPWLTPEDSFEELKNAYVFRGGVKKRFGSELTGTGAATNLQEPLFSRLRIPLAGGANVGITTGAGAANGRVIGAKFEIGQAFSIGNEIFTVYQAGVAQDMLRTGVPGVATFNTTNGDYNFVGAAATTQIYFYPTQPVMGLGHYEVGPVNDHTAYAFDTQFVYKYAGGFWTYDGPIALAIPPIGHFKGSNSQFFWIMNADGTNPDDTNMFVSNFNATIGVPGANDDPMWTYNGAVWATLSPNFTVATDNIYTAKVIIQFKNRLLLLNTIEQNAAGTVNTAYVNRCRWSKSGSPLAADSFYEHNEVGWKGGGYKDIPTEEEIVSAAFIKDRLIVYCERSTWELAYTYNHVDPFIWQKINSELGSEATHSIVPFDRNLLTVGTSGINECNGINVQRIDDKIPDEIFKIVNKYEGIRRIHGVRDYFTEMVYWTFPAGADDANNTYPNRVLVYNYKNGTWAFNDDCITCFGYFEQKTDTTWGTATGIWGEADYAWDSGLLQSNFRQVIAGNQQGYVFSLNSETGTNARVMQITNITYAAATQIITLVIVDHTLKTDEYIKISNAQGVTIAGDGIYQVARTDTDTVTINMGAYLNPFVGVYTGGGTATRVSKVEIKSKLWNPYVKNGDDVYLSKIDFIISKTVTGEITVDYTTSSSNLSMIEESESLLGTGALLGTNVLETFPYPTVAYEAVQRYLKHQIYFQAEGEFVQIHLYFNDEQMITPNIVGSLFELQGMVLHTKRIPA